LLTVPSAALIGAFAYVVTTGPPPVVAGIAVAAGFVATGWLAHRSMQASVGAEDFERLTVADGVVEVHDNLPMAGSVVSEPPDDVREAG
jgi:hypothetical protein